LYILTFLFICCICYFIYLVINLKNLKQNYKSIRYNSGKHLNDNDKNIDIIEPYIQAQKDFCEHPNKYKNQKYENQISLFDVKLNELRYQIYAFKLKNFLNYELKKFGNFEKSVSNNMIAALKFYALKNNNLKTCLS